jgi:hypothetical protein
MENNRLDELHKELLESADDLCDDGVGKQLDLIATSFFHWFLFLVDADPERTLDPYKTYILRESHISALFSTLRLMVHLAKVSDTLSVIDHLQNLKRTDIGGDE